MRCTPLVRALCALLLLGLTGSAPSAVGVTAHPTLLARATGTAEAPSIVAGDVTSRGNLQQTHRLGPDPGMAALRLFLGAGARLEGLARKEADDAYGKGQNKVAVPLLYAAHIFDPADALTLRRLGFAGKSSGYYEVAYDALRRATLEQPASYEAWWWLADTERLLGFYAEAVVSMERAQELAPPDEAEKLVEYIAYSEYLADPTPSWEGFHIHRDFAERHQTTRRMRRVVAEYQEALALVPAFPADDTEAWARIAWVAQQMGYHYAYLQEHWTAIFYFERGARLYERTGVPTDIARCLNNAADSYSVLADTQPMQKNALLDEAIARRERALELVRTATDLQQSRYTMGRLLENVVDRRGSENPRVKELRQLAANEIPWTGPIEEYPFAAIAVGELACRVAEGNLGGARQLLERVRTYFAASPYLEDTLRLARLDTIYAHLHQQQGHAGAAMESARNAMTAAAQVRGFLHAEAFLRSTASVSYRYGACALVRGAIAGGDFVGAMAASEEYRGGWLNTLLGDAAAGESHFADLALEEELAAIRIGEIEADLAEARAEGEADRAARLEEHAARERAGLRRLRARPGDEAITRLLAVAVNPATPPALLEALPDDALYLAYHTDRWGGCVVTAGTEGLGGAVLNEAAEDRLVEAVVALQQAMAGRGDAAAPLSALAEVLVTPLAQGLGGRRLLISPDYVLHGVPFGPMPLGDGFLVQAHDVAHVLSGGHVLRTLTADGQGHEGLLSCRAADGGSEALLFSGNHATAYVEAPVEVWREELPLSALLLRPGDGHDGRLHLAEIATRTLPPALGLCLRDGWPPNETGHEAVQALAQALGLAGVEAAAFNLYQAECSPLRSLVETTPLGARVVSAWQREAIAAGMPLASWAAYVYYGARP